jgi:hypothetical protein
MGISVEYQTKPIQHDTDQYYCKSHEIPLLFTMVDIAGADFWEGIQSTDGENQIGDQCYLSQRITISMVGINHSQSWEVYARLWHIL